MHEGGEREINKEEEKKERKMCVCKRKKFGKYLRIIIPMFKL